MIGQPAQFAQLAMKRLGASVLLGLALAVPGAAMKTLDIFFIDVEGGQSTLIVTPEGQSLLIDAGYGARNGRDPERNLAAAHEAGIDHLDYLLVTHFHSDHVGGVPDLASRIPIETFIDYGEPMGTDRMATGAFRAYEPARNGGRHLQPRPGDRLPLKGIEADVVSAGGAVLPRPLAGAGQANAACATVEDQPEDGTENFRSIGVRLKFGAFRFVDLGDLSGNTLATLVCPRNLVGDASVYLVAHHGNYDSNVPAVLAALRPRVAVMNNGVRKGGAPDSFSTLHAQPGLEDLWQLHATTNPGADNAPDVFLANVDDGVSAYWIKLTANDDGGFAVSNSRNGFTKTYPPVRGRPSR
jgi:competence protein ComEC